MISEDIRSVLNTIDDFYGCGSHLEMDEVLKLAEISQLDRIASDLEALKPLAGCVGTDGQGRPVLYMSGIVTTYEG